MILRPDIKLHQLWCVSSLSSRSHRETRTHVASRCGTLGPLLSLADLSAVHRFISFQVASGNAQRMRADVSELVYRARAFLLLAAQKPSSHRSLITFAACQCLAHASVMA